LGIWHDARLYTLQALAHLKPDLLGNDIFLRFGSQDNYTLFSPLYAAVISVLGVEPAAALLTFVFHLAFFCAAWLLARRILPTNLVLLAVGLLVALPSYYGGDRVFSYCEDFLTPRLPAEALVLGGLAAAIAQRYRWAAVCMAGAALLHPLIAAAGIALLLCQLIALPRPRLALGLGTAFAGAMVVLTLCTPMGAWIRFDSEWLPLVLDRGSYLFLSNWSLGDWGRASVSLATLAVGLRSLAPSPARNVCIAALITGLCGLALALLGSDLLRLVLITQLQPWRWLWLTSVVAVVLLPAITARCWASGPLGRASVLLLGAVWLFHDEIYVFIVAPLAISAAIAMGRATTPRIARLLLWGAAAVFLFAIAWTLAVNFLFAGFYAEGPGIPDILRWARSLARDGVLATMLLVAAWWVSLRSTSRAAPIVLVVAAAAAVAALLPISLAERTRFAYPQQLYQQFAPWRRLIPPGEEVLWVEGPVPTWLLLERPSYLSSAQTTSTLFSKKAAIEMWARAQALSDFLPGEDLMTWGPSPTRRASPELPTLRSVCASSDVKYIVTRADLHAAPLDVAPPGVPMQYRKLQLYRCAQS